LIAVAAGFARPGRLGTALAAALTAISLVTVITVFARPEYQRDDWRGAADSLGDRHEDRAIVHAPATGYVPIRVYRPRISAPPARRFGVRELDVIAMIRDGRDPPRVAPVPGFRLLSTHRDATFVAARFVSDAPRELDSDALRRIRLTPDPTGFVYEPASR
ncbi:MAG: hypothetical protein M3340_19730, partial [Actinomycetota bacterium]|nr:hypothetical protein [Actinomycetota bacterium]